MSHLCHHSFYFLLGSCTWTGIRVPHHLWMKSKPSLGGIQGPSGYMSASFPDFFICSRTFLNVTLNAMGILNSWQFIRHAYPLFPAWSLSTLSLLCVLFSFFFSYLFPKKSPSHSSVLGLCFTIHLEILLNTSLPIILFLLYPQVGYKRLCSQFPVP